MANNIRWHTYSDTDADLFRLYRAITGVVVSFPNALQVGDRLQFAATSPTIQTISITGTEIATVAADINNAAKGARATISADGNSLIIRCNATVQPRFKLMSCSFAAHTYQTPRLVAPRSEFLPLADIVFDPSQSDYLYTDQDGGTSDVYHITTVKGTTESIPSQDLWPSNDYEELCVLEGRLTDLENEPVVGAEIVASIMVPVGVDVSDNAGVSRGTVRTISDELGRWSISLMKDQLVLLQIDTIGYSQVVWIPDQTYILFKDLQALNDHYFNPSGEVAP